MTYRPSLNDIRFCLDHIITMDGLYGHNDFDEDLRDAVLEAAGQLSQDVLAPINTNGDKNPARLDNGIVVLSPGFTEACHAFAEGGWYGLGAAPQHGGQGLPKVLEQACYDMFQSANMAFSLLPTLSQGAIESLQIHGSEVQQQKYLPHLISGRFSGTMNLTEPQAGSDLALLTSKAEPAEDGTYRITGQKIFITWGDHEAAENILHLVLARLPDAPKGTRGISLFLCPKYHVNDDQTLGARNSLQCVGLEHKMGIHGSPTCVMSFENAVGELIGEPHGGLKAMFTMMNAARLAVGLQGVGIADGAWQKAQAYAMERKQGFSPITNQSASIIYNHPDVRLMLGLMKAKTEAARAICYATAAAIDHAHLTKDDTNKAKYQRRADFLVPIAKAWSTDIGVEVASLGVQVHGGMGFIEETGAAQYYRDARIAPIYEGTNGIQAADLAGRKLGTDGLSAKEIVADIRDFLNDIAAEGGFMKEAELLSKALDSFDTATDALINRKTTAPLDVATGAVTYLKLSGDLIGGWLLFKGALAAHSLLNKDSADKSFLSDKIAIARLYAVHVLSHAQAHLAIIEAGFAPLDGLVLSLE